MTRELEADSYTTGTRGNAAVVASAVLVVALAAAVLLVLIDRG